jgi:hypothetical protein
MYFFLMLKKNRIFCIIWVKENVFLAKSVLLP